MPFADSLLLSTNLFLVVFRLGYLIWFFYVLASYYVLFREKKRKHFPQYIKITPTEISIAAGFLLSIFTFYQFDGLGYAIGLMFADYYMFRRLSFIDKNTLFFNEKYLEVLKQEAKKKKIKEVTVFRFKTPEDREKLTELLKFWEPEYCNIISKDDGEFLVISKIQKKHIAERFISLICEHAESRGLKIESSYETVRMDG